ncbi:MAG: ABC transporter permease [Rhodospirillales bacterium]
MSYPLRLIVGIALTHIRGRTRQTALSIIGVTTGVGFAIAMAALMEGSQSDFITRIIDATPHVLVKDEFRNPPLQPVQRRFSEATVGLRGVKPKDELRGIRNPGPKLAALDAMPGLAAAPILRGQVVLRYGGKEVAASLIGIEPKRERKVSQVESDMIAGTFDDLFGTANGIILGHGLARKLAAEIGSTLSVTSPNGVMLKMKVTGLVDSGIVSLDDGTSYALLKKVQVLLERPNIVNEIRVRLADVTQARDIASRIETRIGYRSESWQEANQGVLEVFAIRNIIIYTVVSGILIVAAFGIFNIVSTITFEKAHDIAILKSLGFRESDIRAVFLFEGLLMGGVGTALGWAIGYGLCRLLGSIQIQVRAFSEAATLPVIYEPAHYLIAGAAAISAAAIAGYLPARRAARLNPVDIIRGAA